MGFDYKPQLRTVTTARKKLVQRTYIFLCLIKVPVGDLKAHMDKKKSTKKSCMKRVSAKLTEFLNCSFREHIMEKNPIMSQITKD